MNTFARMSSAYNDGFGLPPDDNHATTPRRHRRNRKRGGNAGGGCASEARKDAKHRREL